MNRDRATFSREQFEPIQQYQPMSFNHRITEKLDAWRQRSHNRFSSREIFREEFLTYADEIMMSDYNDHVEKLFYINKENNKEDLETIKQAIAEFKCFMRDISTSMDALTKPLPPKKKK